MAVWMPTGWKIEKPLVEGGQGWTYLARRRDSLDEKLYVIKRLKNKERYARFKREAEVLSTMSHPRILRIIEIGDSADDPFYVAEYCAH